MSNSQHPIALAVERRVGSSIRLLATVMALPLVDGIFPALLLAGALDTVGGVFEVGLLVFGGSATVAVILADMGENPRAKLPSIAGLGVVLVIVAAVEAAVAPTLAGLIDVAVFERFAAIVILAVAAATASARIAEYIPRPAVLVGLGFIASVQPANATVVVAVDTALVIRAGAAAGIGALFALLLASLAPELRRAVDLDRFRFGSAVALGTFGLSLFGLVPTTASLAVLGVTALLAFDPGSELLGSDESAATLADGGEGDATEDADSGPARDPWL